MDQLVVFITLGLALFFFIWGRIRYDFVALAALFIVAVFGVIPSEQVFLGFGHPAVITVVAVMIISQGMINSGMIDVISKWLQKSGHKLSWQLFSLCSITAVASAFINNVGALAIMMPVSIKLARKSGHSPSSILMPLAFSSLLGGMISLIGTPPNIIISSIRQEVLGSQFRMFDFAPVGISISVIGILFMAFLGWRLIPRRQGSDQDEDLFQIGDYITEVQVTEDSKVLGSAISEITNHEDYEISILALIRNKIRIHIPDAGEILQDGDIIILEADSENLETFVNVSGVKLLGDEESQNEESQTGGSDAKEISLKEVVVLENSKLIGKTAAGLNMRNRYGINLLAIARSNRKIIKRMDHTRFKAGDVLLLQGRTDKMKDDISMIGCIPISSGELRLGNPRRIITSLLIFMFAMTSIISGLIPVQIAFSIAALLFVLSGVISFREVYDEINWPIIVLLGAMIPVGMALERSGGADLIAGQILRYGSNLPHWQLVMLLMLVSLLLSNIINNAATAVLMAPIGVNIAQGLSMSADIFLMAIAIGASSAFLTPIGHQSNTLVMGPGGYKFNDYWRLGLPIQIIVLAVSTPILLMVFK